MSRYSRHITLPEIGQKGQDKLSDAKVLVIGAGGLGCPVLQYLAAAGIGKLGIVDFDTIDESNLQRQILFGSSTLGENKALAAKKRLNDINNTIQVIAYPSQLTNKNAISLFNQYDIIVDGTDNFLTRYIINDASIITHKPVVYGGIYKFEGQVAVFNYQKGASYRCLFPEPRITDTNPNCSEAGVLGVLPGIIGTMQANEVLKIILNLGHVLSGKLFCYNALTTKNHTVSFERNEAIIQSIITQKEDFENKALQPVITDISLKRALQMKNIQFIDVRELNELPKIKNIAVQTIPLSILNSEIKNINTTKTNLLFCQSGTRSRMAVSILNKHNIYNCFSLKDNAVVIATHYNNS